MVANLQVYAQNAFTGGCRHLSRRESHRLLRRRGIAAGLEGNHPTVLLPRAPPLQRRQAPSLCSHVCIPRSGFTFSSNLSDRGRRPQAADPTGTRPSSLRQHMQRRNKNGSSPSGDAGGPGIHGFRRFALVEPPVGMSCGPTRTPIPGDG
jgi:hypothetical protein